MESTNLLIHLYGSKDRALHSIKVLLENELEGLEVEVEVNQDKRGWATITLCGSDEEFALNLLVKKYGIPTYQPKIGKSYKGYVDAINDKYIIVNIGTEVIIDSASLKSVGVGSVKQKASRFGIIPHLPMEVEVTEEDTQTGAFKGKPTKKQEDIWWNWRKAPFDRVIVNAVTRSQLKAAIKRTGHERDINKIERLGLMEHAVVCKEETDGPGLVTEIGPLLKGVIGVVVGVGSTK